MVSYCLDVWLLNALIKHLLSKVQRVPKSMLRPNDTVPDFFVGSIVRLSAGSFSRCIFLELLKLETFHQLAAIRPQAAQIVRFATSSH